MTAPFFTSNDSELTRLEGLYIQEQNPPAQVTGVALNDVGVAGICVRGPVGKLVEITSEARFKEVFGGRDYGAGGSVIGHVWQALLNKPFGRIWVARVAASAAVKASFTAETAAGGGGTAVLRIDASSKGLWGNDVAFRVDDASDGDSNHFNLVVRYLGNTKTYKNLDIHATGVDNTLATLGDDDGNWITLAKLANGRPVTNAAGVDGADTDGFTNLGQTVGSFTSVAGTEGSVAATDYTVDDGPIDLLAGGKGIAVVFVAEPSSSHYAAIKTKIETVAADATDRDFIVGADSETVSASTAETEAAAILSDRVWYAFNHFYTQDPETATSVLCRPESLLAAIISQTDVDIHPGDEDNKAFTKGVTALYNETYQRGDYIGLREAGICALEKDNGFGFVSGVTTSQTPGRTEITRRRSADFLQLSLAAALKFSVKKKNTQARRNANAAMVRSFLNDLKRNERIVEDFIVDADKLNTEEQRAAGIEKLLVRVKLLGHMLFLDLVTEIGTEVQITEVAA